MLRNFIAYFQHHRAERNGALALVIIILIIIAGSQAYFIWYKPPIKDTSEFLAFMDSLERMDNMGEASANVESERIPDKKSFEPFPFDPNTISDVEYGELGFSEKEIKTLRNYQKSGATFKVKSDFKKLYFVDDERYSKLKPYIDLPETLPAHSDSHAVKREYNKSSPRADDHLRKRDTTKWSDTADAKIYAYNPIVCDLNLADTNELKKLPYIGSFYAREIVRYRDELGGYNSLAQLLELYKMTHETLDIIADKVSIDQSKIRKINVNKATTQELAKHPYISFALANAIVSERESNTLFINMNKLCQTGLLNDELCVKLAPYLSF